MRSGLAVWLGNCGVELCKPNGGVVLCLELWGSIVGELSDRIVPVELRGYTMPATFSISVSAIIFYTLVSEFQ